MMLGNLDKFCNQEGCTKPVMWGVMLAVTPDPDPATARYLRLAFGLGVCDDCKEAGKVTVESLTAGVQEETGRTGWDLIVSVIEHMGGMAPVYEYTVVEFQEA